MCTGENEPHPHSTKTARQRAASNGRVIVSHDPFYTRIQTAQAGRFSVDMISWSQADSGGSDSEEIGECVDFSNGILVCGHHAKTRSSLRSLPEVQFPAPAYCWRNSFVVRQRKNNLCLKPLQQVRPIHSQSRSEARCHIYSWRVLRGLDHLDIAAADICLLGKLLLGEICSITQAIDILAEGSIFGLAHSTMI